MGERYIRRAREADVAFLESCTRAAYSKYVVRLGRPPQPMTANYEEMLRNAQVWILECAGELAGLLVLQPEKDQLLIYSVAVDPKFQGEGHGKFLMRFAESEASQQKYVQIELYTNELMHENIGFYTHLGYQETHRQKYKGSNLVYMRKQVHIHA